MSNHKKLIFFNKEGDYLNFRYNDTTDRFEGNILFHENSTDTFKTYGLYMFEKISAFEYEVPDAVWTCERQLRQEYGDYHLADGMVIYGDKRYLIVVDRTQKESNRFQNIASINASMPDVDEVHYWTTTKLIPFVSKQMKSLNNDLQIKIKIFTLPSEVNE
jgi:hypothetical protein